MKKFTMLLFLSLLLAQVAFTQTVDVIYNVTREAYPTALPAAGASISITYTNGANPAVTETKTADAAGTATFTVPLPATGTNYRIAETITLVDHNTYASTSTNGTRITEYTSPTYNAYKFVGLTSTTLKVLVTKDIATSGTPIEGASVTFTCANPVINTTLVTGADGYVSLPVTRGSTADYTIAIAIAPIAGYAAFANATQSITYMPSGNMSTKALAMMWNYHLNLTITQSDGTTPIQGATVTLTGTPASTAQTTGADGKASFIKQKLNTYGSVSYTIVAPGYADSTATILYSAFIDPLDLTIKLRKAYNVNLTITDASAALVSGAIVTLKPKNSAIAATSVTTNSTGVATFARKTNGTYTYMVIKTGFADVAGELTVADADINQGITLNAGADFTFYIKNGTANIAADSLTIDGITKVSPSNGTIVFGLTAGAHNYSNTKVAFVKAIGSVNVDPANPTLNNLTLNLVPIYSLKVGTKDELGVAVPNAKVLFNGNTYQTDAAGTVYIYNIAPKAANERQYYDVRIMKDGYAEYNDSIKCGLVSSKIGQKNQHAVDNNLFIFSKPTLRVFYSVGMIGATSYSSLYLNGVNYSAQLSNGPAGGATFSNFPAGTYKYYMQYQQPGYAPERGTVEVTSNKSGNISVSFAKGYDIQMYTLDTENNPVEGVYVSLNDTTIRTDVDGAVLFKLCKEKSTFAYTAYQKDVNGNIIAKAKGQVILGSVPISGEVIHLTPVTDSIIVKVYNAAVWGEVIPGATVKCDNNTYTTDAQGMVIIPVSADGQYTYTVTNAGYFDYTKTVTVAGENVNEEVYLNKQFSASFTVNDGTNPIEGAIIKVNGLVGITGTTGQLTFNKAFKKSWDAYNFTASVIGYTDYTGTFYVSDADVVVDPISFTTKAYDVTLTVNKPNGTPAPYAQVTFNNAVYTTNALGMLTATKVINGSYTIVVSAAGYIDYTANVTVADANVNQIITLTGGYDLTIQVINGPTGAVGLANTSITINGITKITDAAGLATFGVPANYAVNTTITKAGFVDAPLVIADVNANMTSTVYMTPVYTVNIRVVDNNSYNPISGATVVFNGETKLSDVDGFAKYLNVAPSATAYAYTVTGTGSYNSSNGTIDLPFTSPTELVENGNMVDKTVGLTSPNVFITLTNGMMTYYGAATINFDGVDYAYETGFGGNTFNCSLGTHVYVVTPADETKAILRGTVTLTELEPSIYLPVNIVNGRKIEMYVIDATPEQNTIDDASVTLDGVTQTTVGGFVVFNRKAVNTNFPYTISKTGYGTVTGTANLVTADLVITTVLNTAYKVTVKAYDNSSTSWPPAGLEGATVTFNGNVAITDANGVATLPDETNGTYEYTVSKAGFVTVTGSAYIEDADVMVEVYMNPAFSVQFTITDGTNPVANASIRLVSGWPVFDQTFVTDAQGVLLTDKLFPKWTSLEFTVSAAGFADSTGAANIQSTDLVVDPIALKRAYEITFTVNDGTNPVSDAAVTINNVLVTTNAGGNAVFTKMINGDYSYVVSKPGYVDMAGTVTVTDANSDKTGSLAIGYNRTFTILNGPTGTVGLANDTITINGISKITDATGTVVFGVAPNAAISFVNKKAGFVSVPVEIASVTSDMSQTINMVPVYNVAFRAVDNFSFNPIAGATVLFNGLTVTTDVDGFSYFTIFSPVAVP